MLGLGHENQGPACVMNSRLAAFSGIRWYFAYARAAAIRTCAASAPANHDSSNAASVYASGAIKPDVVISGTESFFNSSVKYESLMQANTTLACGLAAVGAGGKVGAGKSMRPL
jgi:hypothetical protein